MEDRPADARCRRAQPKERPKLKLAAMRAPSSASAGEGVTARGAQAAQRASAVELATRDLCAQYLAPILVATEMLLGLAASVVRRLATLCRQHQPETLRVDGIASCGACEKDDVGAIDYRQISPDEALLILAAMERIYLQRTAHSASMRNVRANQGCGIRADHHAGQSTLDRAMSSPSCGEALWLALCHPHLAADQHTVVLIK
jgi:hypothetical protein